MTEAFAPYTKFDPLGFSLAPFARLAWVSPAARARWEPTIARAAAQLRRNSVIAALAGQAAPVLIAAAPTEVPTLLALPLSHGGRAKVLGELPQAFGDFAFYDRRRPNIWSVFGGAEAVDAAEVAWREERSEGLLQALQRPECCAKAFRSTSPAQLPGFAVMTSGRAQERDFASNYLLHPVGLAPAPWIPCSAACTYAHQAAYNIRADAAEEILNWPMSWSALHGIGQTLTPYFRLVHDTVSTSHRVDTTRTTNAPAPVDAPIGLVHPFQKPKARVRGRSFERGLENASTLDRLGSVELETVSFEHLSKEQSQPCKVGGVTNAWPALRRWTASYLLARFGDAPISLSKNENPEVPARFSEYLNAVCTGGALSDYYLRDFNFLAHAPEMEGDFSRPEQFASWHHETQEDFRLITLYLGAAGTGSDLHSDILNTSAWNAVIWGQKQWLFVAPGADLRDLEAHPNLWEANLPVKQSLKGVDMRTCIQNPGDLVFIPHGWLHAVRNLSPTLALTENFVNAVNRHAVELAIASCDDPRLMPAKQLLSRAIAWGTRYDTATGAYA